MRLEQVFHQLRRLSIIQKTYNLVKMKEKDMKMMMSISKISTLARKYLLVLQSLRRKRLNHLSLNCSGLRVFIGSMN